MKSFLAICSRTVKSAPISAGIFLFALVTGFGSAALTADSQKVLSSQEQESSDQSASSKRKVDLTKRVTLDLRNMNVVDALKYIGLRSGMNIVTSREVTGSVSFQVQDVPISDILDITLLSNNLAYEKIGEIYYMMSEKEYKERFGKSFSDARQVRFFHLDYAIPQKAFDLLDTLKSSVGRILVDQESATVMVMDTPEKIKLMEHALTTLEEKNQIQVFNLQYATAKDVQDQLKLQIDDKNLGLTKADERSNQVVVQTLPGRMSDVEQMIKSLDKKTKEVLIDTKIVKITLSDATVKDFSWEGMFKSLASGNMFLGNHPYAPIFRTGEAFIDDYTQISPTDANATAGAKSTLTDQVFLGRLGADATYELLIKFLQTLGNTKLVSNPKLAVVNNQEAKIHVGRKEAYVTSTTTTGQTTSTTAEQVTFIDIGIQLAVTPIINDDGYVTMKIKPEISSVVDTLETPSGNKIPIVDTSIAETTIMVKDNKTIIIGGLRREDEVTANKRVPGLGRIPIVGQLFSSKNSSKERSEIIILITPTIMEGNLLVTGDERDQPGDSKDYKKYHEADDLLAPGRVISAMGEEQSPLKIKEHRLYDENAPKDLPPAKELNSQLNLKSYRN